jgi:hypothetical protein
MKVNMGSVDRIVRISLAVTLGIFILTRVISGVTAAVLGIIALVFLATGIFSRCMLYYPLGISTCKRTPVDENGEKKDSDKEEKVQL